MRYAAKLAAQYMLGLLEAVHNLVTEAGGPLENFEEYRVRVGHRRIQRLKVLLRLTPRANELLLHRPEPSLTHGLAHDPLVASGPRQRSVGRVPPGPDTRCEAVRQVRRRVKR